MVGIRRRLYDVCGACRLDMVETAAPTPKRLNPAVPDAFLKQRQQWILKQMHNLGPDWVP